MKSDPCLWGVGGGCKLVLGTFTNITVEQVKKKEINPLTKKSNILRVP